MELTPLKMAYGLTLAQSALEPLEPKPGLIPHDFLQVCIFLAVVSFGGIFVQWCVSVITLGKTWVNWHAERKVVQLMSGFMASMIVGLLLHGTQPQLNIYLKFGIMLLMASGGVPIIVLLRERIVKNYAA